MNRRNFIRNGSLTGISTALSFTVFGQPDDLNHQLPDDEWLEEATIDSLQEKMASGKLTSVALTKAYLNRITLLDKAGPKLNAVIEVNPDALAIAQRMDDERKNKKLRGPLHGIPVLIKDNIDTADKMQTTAGALALQGHIAKKDAFIITKLREAGAVLLGKTNLSEWANFRSSNSCSGWSSRGGQTRNPYILDHNPCGSSAGSGAAVAANLCVIAIGTETDGSIVCPSSVNNLVGIKPTVGLLSRSGIIPISSTQDTAGPMARTVSDAVILLYALSGTDPLDKATAQADLENVRLITDTISNPVLRGRRIAVDKKSKSVNTAVNALLDECLAKLKKLGAEIVEVEYVDKINELGKYELTILQHEFKDGVNKYLSGAGHKMKTLKDVIDFNKANEAKAMPYFKQEQLENCEKTTGLDSKEYLEAIEKGTNACRQLLNDLIAEHKLDAIIGITMGPACSIDMIYGDRWGDIGLTSPAAMSGFPHITLPAGWIYDLPVGISFFGAAWSQPKLIHIARAYEQAYKQRRKPGYTKAFLR